MNIEMLPPNLNLNIKAKIRLNVLAGVLDELTKACGVDIEDSLIKGVVERDVIDTITVKFKDIEGKIKSRIIFSINWEKLELLAKNDDGEILYQGTDFSSNLSKQLDKKLYDALKVFVNRTKKKHNIEKVDCSFSYREKYLKTEEIHNATREYMDHIKGKIEYFANDNQEFEHEIKTFFQGLDDILGITFDC